MKTPVSNDLMRRRCISCRYYNKRTINATGMCDHDVIPYPAPTKWGCTFWEGKEVKT